MEGCACWNTSSAAHIKSLGEGAGRKESTRVLSLQPPEAPNLPEDSTPWYSNFCMKPKSHRPR